METRTLFISLLLLDFALLFVFSVGVVLANNAKVIHAKALDSHDCDSTEWHFVINQISSENLAPSSIRVTWANNVSENVLMWKFTGKVAHYVTVFNLGSTVTGASAEIYADWKGQFNLSHGPCSSPTPTPTFTPTSTPTATPTATPTDTPTSTPDVMSVVALPVTGLPFSPAPALGLGFLLLLIVGLARVLRREGICR